MKPARIRPLVPVVLMALFLSACASSPARSLRIVTPAPVPQQAAQDALSDVGRFHKSVFLPTPEPAPSDPSEPPPDPDPAVAMPSDPDPTTAPAPSESAGASDPDPAAGDYYVVNTHTGKFHKPSCASVPKIKESNKLDFQGPRDELLAMGYVPCKACSP